VRIEIQLIILAIIGIIFIVPKIMPHAMSDTEKEYMSHFNQAYKLYQDNRCQDSVDEFKKAEQILDNEANLYVRMAYSYECLEDYENAIKSAKESLKRKDSKAYRKANGFMFKSVLSEDIGAYTVIGDSSLKLKRYKDAKDAFTYVIDNVKYTYTDAYFKRGKSEYYLGETKEALADFAQHEAIIRTYLDEQANSEYTATYPTYTAKDLDDVNEWMNKLIKNPK
jgi:tetratricopeptide (TPR) repeat protein